MTGNIVLHAYHCTKHEVTGLSPFVLMYGRSPRLPIDLAFGLREAEEQVIHTEYANQWQRRMHEAYELVKSRGDTAAEKSKERYDKGAGASVLSRGDRVLVRNLGQRGGPGKLRNYWEDGIHVVLERCGNDSPLYQLGPERGNGRKRTLHRNLLLPCHSLERIEETSTIRRTPKTTPPRWRQSKLQTRWNHLNLWELLLIQLYIICCCRWNFPISIPVPESVQTSSVQLCTPYIL